MTIIVGHSNMDADCLGSVLLARALYPDAIAIKSTRVHPFVKRLLMLHEDEMGLVRLNEIDAKAVTHCIVVDTHSVSQVQEYFKDLSPTVVIHAIDHHLEVPEPLPGTLHLKPYGSNCAVLCELLMERGLKVDPDTATYALAGIYADTGNFTHDNVHDVDFAAAQYLLSCGAKVRVVRKFTNRLPDDTLMNIFHGLLAAVEHQTIQGMRVAISSIEVQEQVPGLALVVERFHEADQSDASFCIFTLPTEKSHLIIARSSVTQLDLAYVLSQFGGGGHRQAASALLKKSVGIPVRELLVRTISSRTAKGQIASELMERNPPVLYDTWSLFDASIYLENHSASGAPVLGAGDILMGMLSLRDIQKGRKNNAMHSPVKAFMSRKLYTVGPETTAHELEELFMHHDINKLPVLDQGNLVGLISRSDCLRRIHED